MTLSSSSKSELKPQQAKQKLQLTKHEPQLAKHVIPAAPQSAANLPTGSTTTVYTYSNAACNGVARSRYTEVSLNTCLAIPEVATVNGTAAHMKLTQLANSPYSATGGGDAAVNSPNQQYVYTVSLYPSTDTSCSMTASHQYSTNANSVCAARTHSNATIERDLPEWTSIQVGPTAEANAEQTVDCHGATDGEICQSLISSWDFGKGKSSASHATEPHLLVAIVSSFTLMWQLMA